MVLDSISNFEQYVSLHPLFAKVQEVLKTTNIAELPAGKINYPQYGFRINVDEVDLRSREEAYLEAHDKYIDIQIPLSVGEEMGYRQREECNQVRTASEERDIIFYNESPSSYFNVEVGQFVIFFPQDAHAPIIGEGRTKKIVVKIPVTTMSNI